MTDEQDKLADGQPQAEGGQAETPPVIDDWASAFASLEEPPPAAAAGDQAGTGTGAAPATEPGTEGAAPAAGAAPEPGADALGAADDGGSLPAGGEAGDGDAEPALGNVEEVLEQYSTTIEQRAMDETAHLFLERTDEQGRKLIRQTDGKLGATVNDPDIYRVDPDTGVATFHNPDTGKPFTGDNPRAQAKQWVDAYNEELRETFNNLAEKRQAEIEAEMAPVIELLKFTPTYEKLDPVRQKLFDALIEGYEVYDADGDHIGYSVDLNRALEQVNRQVAAIQASRSADPAAPSKAPTGPALDMPTTGGGNTGGNKEFKSLAEAMEAAQDAELAKRKK